jgi:TolB-like protein
MNMAGLVTMDSSHAITLKKFFFVLLYFLGGMLVTNSCHNLPAPAPIGFETPGIRQVLVLPIENMTAIYGENTSLRNPISGKVFITGYVATGAENLLTRLLIDKISDRKNYQLIFSEQVEGIAALKPKNKFEEQDQLRKVIQIGKRLRSDVVLIGHVYRFKDRIGSDYAAKAPASVGFDLNMVDTHNGTLIWSGHFDETQKALNENLFLINDFLKRRGRWVTAGQMASTALKELVGKMPRPYVEP